MDRTLVFGDCTLSVDRLLSTPAGESQLTFRQAAILETLVQARSVAVSTDTLLDIAWGKGAGTPQNLAKAIFVLRGALQGSQTTAVQSVYGYGYRLMVESTESRAPDPAQIAASICKEAAHRLHERREISLESARSMYERAAQLDPSCVSAYLGYAETWLQAMFQGWQPASRGWPAILDAVGQILETAPLCSDALAYRGLGECVFYWDFPTAEATFAESLGLESAGFLVNDFLARAALFQGQGRRAIHHFQAALASNPMAMTTRGHLAYAYTSVGEIEAARAEIDRMLQMDPSGPVLGSYGGWIEAAYGDPDEACRITEERLGHLTSSTTGIAVRAFAYARAGHEPAARALLSTLTDRARVAAPDNALLCMVWVALGDHEAALRALEAAARSRDYWLGPMLNHPINAPLHGVPGFTALRDSVFSPPAGLSTSRRRSARGIAGTETR